MNVAIPDLWILISLSAAVFQTVRFMLQKYLATSTLSAGGATFSRFFYSLPFIILSLFIYMTAMQVDLPSVGQSFWGFGLLGAVSQITATVCTVLLFKQRNFAVGMAFKKTEVIQTVIVGWLLLGEVVSVLGFGAILLGIVGLLLLSAAPSPTGFKIRDFWNKGSALGITSGILFAFSAVSYRGATIAVASDDPFLRAGLTLAVVVTMQTAIMLVWLRLREPGQIKAVWNARRVAVWIGLTSMGGSLGWFIAFALQNAAYVKAVGQVEIILSIAASVLFFREKISAREWIGMTILVVSILMLVLVI